MEDVLKGQGSGYRQNVLLHAVLSKISDAAVVFFSLYLSVYFYSDISWDDRFVSFYSATSWDQHFVLLGLVAMLVFFLIGEIAGLYQSWRGVPFRREALRLLITWVITLFIILLGTYVLKVSSTYSRGALLSWFVSVLIILSAWRFSMRYILCKLRSYGYNTRFVAVVGAGEQGTLVADAVVESPELGLQLSGVFDDRVDSDRPTHWGRALSGGFDDLVEQAKQGDFDLIYIALPMVAQPRIMELIERLSDTTASVYLVPDFFTFNMFHGQWTSLKGINMVSAFDTPFWGADGWLKRTQDIVFGSIIMIIILLPMLVIALIIKLTSSGPVLFKQLRYGIDGSEIEVFKFRSMTVMDNGAEVVQAGKNDARVTPFGGFLRRTSLDELPQFINVLMGTMSIVGPRPHAVAHNEEYRSKIRGYMLRHAVKPGITGWAQINGWRGETETLDKMEGRIEFDLWYIRNWSFWLDVRIIFKTILKGFVGTNVY